MDFYPNVPLVNLNCLTPNHVGRDSFPNDRIDMRGGEILRFGYMREGKQKISLQVLSTLTVHPIGTPG